MKKLSIVLATKNEEKNIGPCLNSVKNIADEIIVVDEYSTDRTQEIAKKYGAKVFEFKHKNNFHEAKQVAMEKATGEWILQLDADERVSQALAKEIRSVIELDTNSIRSRKTSNKKAKLFKRHQNIIEQRDGSIGIKTGEVVAFFIPRVNYFLNKPLIHAGVYPDASIRLVKNGKGEFPAKSVHEQMKVKGEVSWLFNDLDHHDSPTLRRYVERANRYTTLTATDFKTKKIPRGFITLLYYSTVKPLLVFFKLYFRHKGFMDGIQGFLWSMFSALHFPIAYFKYFIGLEEAG